MTTGADTAPTWTNYTPGVSERTSGTSKFNHSGIKNVDAQSASNQTVSATREYDAFGNVTSSTGSQTGRFGYGGPYGYQQDEGGLKQLGHRLYDPVAGRFVTRDIAKAGRNWMTYCRNNPLKWADLSGLGDAGSHGGEAYNELPEDSPYLVVPGKWADDGKIIYGEPIAPGEHTNQDADTDFVIIIDGRTGAIVEVVKIRDGTEAHVEAGKKTGRPIISRSYDKTLQGLGAKLKGGTVTIHPGEKDDAGVSYEEYIKGLLQKLRQPGYRMPRAK